MEWLTKSITSSTSPPAWLWLGKHAEERLPEPERGCPGEYGAGDVVEAEARRLFPLRGRGDAPFRDGPDASAKAHWRPADRTPCYSRASSRSASSTRAPTCCSGAGELWDLYEIKGSTKVKKRAFATTGLPAPWLHRGRRADRPRLRHSYKWQYEAATPSIPPTLSPPSRSLRAVEALAAETAGVQPTPAG